MTIGGGEVIDPLPLNHKKNSQKIIRVVNCHCRQQAEVYGDKD